MSSFVTFSSDLGLISFILFFPRYSFVKFGKLPNRFSGIAYKWDPSRCNSVSCSYGDSIVISLFSYIDLRLL